MAVTAATASNSREVVGAGWAFGAGSARGGTEGALISTQKVLF